MIVTLDSLWLNDALNFADCFVAEFSPAGALAPGKSVKGEVRTYSTGRDRAYVRAGSHRSYDVTLTATAADVSWLDSKAGKLLLVRDPYGAKFYGMFFDFKPLWHRGDNGADVSLSFAQVTHDATVS